MPAWESDALIVDAVRSPIGKRNGTLASIRGDELAGQVLNALVRRQDPDPAEVEDVQLGCVTQVGEQGWNIGRMTPLVAGWPETVCGTTVDRQCGSSMQCNFNAAAAIASGQLDLVVSAGVEMMSRVPMGWDGAASVLVASERAVSRLGLEPRARFVSFGLSGVDPHRMLHGNPESCARALARAGLTWDDIAVIEVNEAFASVVLQFVADAALDERMADVNPNG